jgi:hypothetical protein
MTYPTAASGHVPIDLPNSQCAYVPGGPFDTSRFKISYALVSLISIADQSASVIAHRGHREMPSFPPLRCLPCGGLHRRAHKEGSKPARLSRRKSLERCPLGEPAISRVRRELPLRCQAAPASRGLSNQNSPQETATPLVRQFARLRAERPGPRGLPQPRF